MKITKNGVSFCRKISTAPYEGVEVTGWAECEPEDGETMEVAQRKLRAMVRDEVLEEIKRIREATRPKVDKK